jgi:YVTN family beta-propeller protein
MSNRSRIIAPLCTAVLVAGVAVGIAITHSHRTGSTPQISLTASSCGGPAGAAYVAVPGYQGFTAVDTANCKVITTYNVDDLPVPGDPGDYNYTGSAPGIALSGTTLWFAVAATDNVAVIDTTALDASNYNPPETLIPVGHTPQALAVTPDGHRVWVIDSGPQTITSSLWDIDVIDASTHKVVAHIHPVGDPTDVAFSPNGEQAYVTTSHGLYIYDVANEKQVAFIPGLGSPNSVAVAPNGSAVYVTETADAKLATINTSTHRILRTTKVGAEPWQAVVSSDGSRVYVANPDSDSISVVDAKTGSLRNAYSVPGAPDALGLTPDGKQLWVAGDDSGILTVIDTSTGDTVGSTNLGGDGPNSGDGLDPTGIVLTTTPTAGG